MGNGTRGGSLATVGFDFTSGAWQTAGIGRATRGLLTALLARKSDFRYFPFYPGAKASARADEFFEASGVSCRRIPISERVLIALWQKLRIPLPVELAVGRVDLFHGPDFVLPPMLARSSVVTIHDLSYVTHPETAHPAQKRFLDLAVPRAVERATMVIAVSHATRADIIKLYGANPDKIAVVHNGLDPLFQREITAAARKQAAALVGSLGTFALSVGTVQPRKNIPAMAAAVGRLRKDGHDIHFVHAGAEGWLSDRVHSEIAAIDDGFVHFLGPVTDDVLTVLYEIAFVTLAVSKAEGFMFPIIESMAMGTPVVTSNISSMPEVAGEAALMVSPDEVDEIAAAVERIIGDDVLLRDLTDRGLRRAVEFSWADAAEKTESVYRTALEMS